MYLMMISLISMVMLTTKSPIMIGIYIFLQAFMFTILISSISFSTWSAYMLFIVCLGGVLIVFLYVIMTLTIGMDPGKMSSWSALLMLFITFFEINDFSNSSETEISKFIFEMQFQEKFSLMKICSMANFKFSVFLMILLFMSMVIVVNLTKKKSGASLKI